VVPVPPTASAEPGSAGRVDRSRSVTGGRGRRTLALLGPAFVAAVAYVDPGNVATNLQAGARYGYLLVWVLVGATVAAGLVQYLSAKLGIVTGSSLPELVGRRLPGRSRVWYWLQAEGVAMATDVAEVIGGAVALQLLFGLPLLLGGAIAGAVSLALLAVQNRRGQRPFERVVTGLLAIIAVGFLAGLVVQPPSAVEMATGLVPRFAGTESMLLATAMLGATVMPHVVYLHSALTRDRFGPVPPGARRRHLLAGTRLDVVIAMILAGAVNIALLLLAASGLQGAGNIDTIEQAHTQITSTFGPAIGVLFAVGLLASGLASASVGCYAGSVIMDGLLKRRIHLLLRRGITLLPALLLLAAGADPTSTLVLSQVVLSFGLPFVLVPLMILTGSRQVMGTDASGPVIRVLGWGVTAAIVLLNGFLILGYAGA
jgi:manganese transport protein